MAIEIKVPVLPESVKEGNIAKWYKKVGEWVSRDEQLLDVETDKVVLEVVAPEDGTLESILKKEGETVKSQEVVAMFKPGKEEKKTEPSNVQESKTSGSATKAMPKAEPAPVVKNAAKEAAKDVAKDASNKVSSVTTVDSPSIRRKKAEIQNATSDQNMNKNIIRQEERVPMTRIRARIAERLLQAQQNAAILTTFNEVNMQPIMEMRQKYKEIFEKTHGVRLGLMSFFTVACVEALKRFPIINASVEGTDILYHNYFDIGIAVSAPRGLVVPVLRDVDTLTMADIEKKIIKFAELAKNNQLALEDLTGGTFTITNGGVFGSLFATPIINPPQSAILGMHKIEERPIALNGAVVIRPMMYIALSYDHRIIDGADSVRFLVAVKEVLEDPARLCLGI